MPGAHASPGQPLLDGFADRVDLRLALARTQQKIIRKRPGAAQVQHRDVHGLLILSRFHSPINFRAESVVRHRYRACPKMYASTRAGTSPWMF